MDEERLWNIFFEGNPATTFVDSAGGIDSFLAQEGYAREFGLQKRARSAKDETNQAHHENEYLRTRICVTKGLLGCESVFG